MSSLIIVAGYKMNKAYITENFCENIDEPDMCCEGMCHVEKQLKAESDKAESPNSTLKEKQETVQFFQSNKIFAFASCENRPTNIFFYLQILLSKNSADIFHPPSV